MNPYWPFRGNDGEMQLAANSMVRHNAEAQS